MSPNKNSEDLIAARANQTNNHVQVAGLWSGPAEAYFGEGTDQIATDDGMMAVE